VSLKKAPLSGRERPCIAHYKESLPPPPPPSERNNKIKSQNRWRWKEGRKEGSDIIY